MSTLTSAQRDALPESDFGDPERRLYPIKDQDDVDSAAHLIGKAHDPDAVKRRIRAIAKRKNLTIPDAWQGDADMAADVPYVTRSGLIFRAGDYPDKGVSIDEADLDAAVEAFTYPVEAELEHINTKGTQTILDGRLGSLRRIWRDGSALFGEIAVPTWLDPIWADYGRKVSIVWQGGKRAIRRVGLVLEPRVTDAMVMSAYSAFAGARHSGSDAADIQQIHDLATRQGASCADDDAEDKRKEHGMSVQRILYWFGLGRERREEGRRAGIEEIPPEETFSVIEQAKVAEVESRFTAEMAASEQRTRDLREQVATLTRERVQAEGAMFADGEIAAGRAYPAEREPLIALYTQAGIDDARQTAVAFADGETSRVAALKALCRARPAHGLDREQLDGRGQLTVVMAGKRGVPTADDMSDEALLALTATGRAALAQRRKQA